MLFGLPLTYTLKDVEPFTFTLSCPSTLTIGTFLSISITVLVCDSGSSSTLYVSLSMSAFTSGLYATTSTPFSSVLLSLTRSVPRFWLLDCLLTVKKRRNGVRLTDFTSST